MAKKEVQANREDRRAVLSSTLKSVVYRPGNQSQGVLAGVWERSVCAFIVGPAGTGKTTGAFGESLMDVIHRERGQRTIYLTRPTIQAEDTDDLGFMPGTLRAKFGTWLPAFSDVLGSLSNANLAALDPILDLMPIGFAREIGRASCRERV